MSAEDETNVSENLGSESQNEDSVLHSGDNAEQEASDEAAEAPQNGPSPAAVLVNLAARSVLTVQPGGGFGAPDPAPRVLARISSASREDDGGGGSGSGSGAGPGGAPAAVDPAEQEAMRLAKERGNTLFAQHLYGEAAAAYTDALRLARSPEDVATLLSNRSAAYASLSRSYRSRPAARSECAALFDLDPTSLAALALKDAAKAVAVRPGWAKAYSRQGTALFLLERYIEAREAYLEGLGLEPTNAALQAGLREVQALLGDAPTPPGGPSSSPSTSAPAAADAPAAAAAGPASPTGGPQSAAKRARVLGPGAGRQACDEWECGLCSALLFEPVTTPCGHTFCRECFGRAVDHNPRCPYCRTVLHMARDQLPVTVTLAAILQRAFPEEYEERRREVAAAAAGGDTAVAAADPASDASASASQPGQPQQLTLPLFVMSWVMPGESMALNVFEPRYRLMVRRVMEGGRRFGMAQVRRADHALEDVAVEVEVLDCQTQPDGRYYLEVVGRRRVRIVSASELDGYRVARCEVLADNGPAPGTPEHEALPELVEQVDRQLQGVLGQLRSMAGRPGPVASRVRALLEGLGERPPAGQAERFSFWAASVACALCPDLDRATLLRGTDTAARLRALRQQGAGRGAGGPGGAGCSVM